MFSLSAISVRWLSLFLAHGEVDLLQARLKRGSLFYLSEDNGIMQLFFIKTKWKVVGKADRHMKVEVI